MLVNLCELTYSSRGFSLTFTHGFDGVDQQIENHLLQLDSIA